MGGTLLSRSRLWTRSGPTANTSFDRYQMRQQAAVQGGDFWIEDQFRRHRYRIDGTRSESRPFMDLEDAHGDHLCRVSPQAGAPWAIEIGRPDGSLWAVVPGFPLLVPQERTAIDVVGAAGIDVSGSVTDYDFDLHQGGRSLGSVSRRWFKAPLTYGVQLDRGEDPVLLLAVGVALDLAAHRPRPAGVGVRLAIASGRGTRT